MAEIDLRNGRVVICDTETTGFSPYKDALVEVAGLEMIDLRLTGRKYHAYINPRRTVPPSAVAVHGLTNEFLKDKPYVESVLPEFVSFIGGSPFVAHNARFDISFVNRGIQSITGRELDCPVVDTLGMAKEKLNTSRLSLDQLCDRLNVSRTARTLHGALLDCEILAEVFIKLVTFGEGGLDLKAPVRRSRLALTPRNPGGTKASPAGTSSSAGHASELAESLAPGSASAEERARHRAFIEAIGAGLWKRHPF
ncbi:exonuclease domain-containing protein [Gluconobacter cerinus]